MFLALLSLCWAELRKRARNRLQPLDLETSRWETRKGVRWLIDEEECLKSRNIFGSRNLNEFVTDLRNKAGEAQRDRLTFLRSHNTDFHTGHLFLLSQEAQTDWMSLLHTGFFWTFSLISLRHIQIQNGSHIIVNPVYLFPLGIGAYINALTSTVYFSFSSITVFIVFQLNFALFVLYVNNPLRYKGHIDYWWSKQAQFLMTSAGSTSQNWWKTRLSMLYKAAPGKMIYVTKKLNKWTRFNL